eukprot:gene482-515_t
MTDEEYQVYNENIDELQNLLFPNQTLSKPSFSLAQHWGQFRRKLGITKKAYTSSVPCTTCLALSNCPALNGYMVQEVYYPKNTALRETCTVLNELGGRMAATIFGEGRTFRDTSQCRLMVMQYLCLFWGTNNDMYTNYCVYQEAVLANGELSVAARPPCHSFCVQIADVCANDPDYFIQSCENIACPPTKDECTPDPTLEGKVLAANLGCAVPYYSSPYFRANSSYRIVDHSGLCLFLSALIGFVWFLTSTN